MALKTSLLTWAFSWLRVPLLSSASLSASDNFVCRKKVKENHKLQLLLGPSKKHVFPLSLFFLYSPSLSSFSVAISFSHITTKACVPLRYVTFSEDHSRCVTWPLLRRLLLLLLPFGSLARALDRHTLILAERHQQTKFNSIFPRFSFSVSVCLHRRVKRLGALHSPKGEARKEGRRRRVAELLPCLSFIRKY